MEAATWEAINAGLVDLITINNRELGLKATQIYREQSGWRRSRQFLQVIQEQLSIDAKVFEYYFAELRLNALIAKEASQLPNALDVEGWILGCLERGIYTPIMPQLLQSHLFRRLPAIQSFVGWLLGQQREEPDWKLLKDLPADVQSLVYAGRRFSKVPNGPSLPALRELGRLLDPTKPLQLKKLCEEWTEPPAGDELLTLSQRWSRVLANRALGAAMLAVDDCNLVPSAFLPPPASLQIRSSSCSFDPFEPFSPEQQSMVEQEVAAWHAIRQLNLPIDPEWLHTQLTRGEGESNTGLVMALALQGRLAQLARDEDCFAIMARKDANITGALLIGLAVEKIGLMDASVLRLLAQHLPNYNLLGGPCPSNVALQQAALIAHALLHTGTRDPHATQYHWRLLKQQSSSTPSLLFLSAWAIGLINVPILHNEPMGLRDEQLDELCRMAQGEGGLPAHIALAMVLRGSKHAMPPCPHWFSPIERFGHELMMGLVSEQFESLGGRLAESLLHLGECKAVIPTPPQPSTCSLEWRKAVEQAKLSFEQDFNLLSACLSHAGSGNEDLIRIVRGWREIHLTLVMAELCCGLYQLVSWG